MYYYINYINSNSKQCIQPIKSSVTYRIIDNSLIIDVSVSIRGCFSLPINTILVNLNTNFGRIENINLDSEVIDNKTGSGSSMIGDHIFKGTSRIDIKDSNFFKNNYYTKRAIETKIEFKLDYNKLQSADLYLNSDEAIEFMKEYFAINSNNTMTIKPIVYYTNTFNYFDDMQNYYKNFIKQPLIKPSRLVTEFYSNQNESMSNFLRLSSNDINDRNQFSKDLSELNIDIYYTIDYNNKHLNIKLDKVNNEWLDINKLFFTNYDFINQEIIQVKNNQQGYNGVYFPYDSLVNFYVWFKYKNSYYYHQFFYKNTDLFGKNSNMKVDIKNG